jgi:hypothetical protein
MHERNIPAQGQPLFALRRSLSVCNCRLADIRSRISDKRRARAIVFRADTLEFFHFTKGIGDDGTLVAEALPAARSSAIFRRAEFEPSNRRGFG